MIDIIPKLGYTFWESEVGTFMYITVKEAAEFGILPLPAGRKGIKNIGWRIIQL